MNNKVYIFKLNHCEWWAAETLEQAIKAACKASGELENELIYEPYQLTENELKEYIVIDPEGIVNSQTFKEALDSLLKTHRNFIPCLFASTEW